MEDNTSDPLGFLRKTATQQLEDEDIVIDEDSLEKDKEKEKEKEKEKKKDTPPPKGKEENIAALRAQKDALKKEKDALEQEIAELRKLKPLSKVADYIKKKSNKDTFEESDVDEVLIKTNKERKQKLGELDQKLKSKDEAIKELSIEQSEEWQTEYVAPVKKAATNIFATVSSVKDDGTVREEELTNNFIRSLVKLDDEGNPKTPTQIRSELARFRKAFEEKTAIDYEAPRLSELVEAVEAYHDKIFKAGKARKAWDQTLEEKKKERIFNEAKTNEAYIEKELKGRNYLFEKMKGTESYKTASSLVSDEEFSKIAESEHEFLQSTVKPNQSIPKRSYDEMLLSLAKGKAFDSLATKLSELQKENESLKKKLQSGLPPAKGVPKNDDKQIIEDGDDDIGDPMGFLRAKR